jgi:predicted acyltransferase
MKAVNMKTILEPGAGKPTPSWLRRGLWEPLTLAMIGIGLVMLMQPFAKPLFTYSFVVLLAGVAGYSIAGKLPE